MSIWRFHTCKKCGNEIQLLVDNGMILEVATEKDVDELRRRVLAYDFGVDDPGPTFFETVAIFIACSIWGPLDWIAERYRKWLQS